MPQSPPDGTQRVVVMGSGTLTAAVVAGTRGIGDNLLVLTGANVAGALSMLYLAMADHTVLGIPAKFQVRGQLATNAVAPGGNWTFGLHPVSATAGAAGGLTYTIGAAVTGSTAQIATPAASSRLRVVGAEFDPPADGFYCLGLVTSAALATAGFVAVTADLRVRNG